MTESISFMDISNSQTSEATVEIFDPPMCCPTGMFGPTIDQTLLNVNEMILTLQADGVSVVRYQMTSHPQAFLNNVDVMRLRPTPPEMQRINKAWFEVNMKSLEHPDGKGSISACPFSVWQ